MNKRKYNRWLVVGVLIAVTLLMWWLISGSIISEDGSYLINPIEIG